MYRDAAGCCISILNNIRKNQKYMDFYNNRDLKKAVRKNCELKTVLFQNKCYREKYKGKRCFILGNGPSLNQIDFSLLENEFVFTVNRLTRHPDFSNLKPNFHIITDLATFGLEKACNDKKNGLEQIRALKNLGRPVLFVPLEAKKILEREHLSDELKIHYLYHSRWKFTDGFRSCDLTKPIPQFRSVIQYAILCAVYMGFTEINLLGCDQTILRDVIDSIQGKQLKNDHAYPGEEMLNTLGYRKVVKKSGFIIYLDLELNQQKVYGELYNWCRSKKIKLYNLTDNTLIDRIPHKTMEGVLGK